MNALLCKPCVATDADICTVPGLQEDFATGPMQALENRVTDEEALHILFEEAISERISASGMPVHAQKLVFASTGPLHNTAVKQALSTLASEDSDLSEHKQTSLLGTGWRRSVSYVCIALMLILIGFDLMGLLILRLH